MLDWIGLVGGRERLHGYGRDGLSSIVGGVDIEEGGWGM